MIRSITVFVITLIVCSPVSADLRAGAAAVDVSPKQFPVLINGGMLSRTASEIIAPVKARALVLDDGTTRIGIVVVDSCMMPRELLDAAKKLAANRTKIQPDRMLISATHTHSAPSSLACLGTEADAAYTPLLRAGIADALVRAEKNLEPASVGWAVANCAEFTALRRWIRRPDRIDLDPFGNRTVRANMHAGNNWDNVVGESGPEDPDLSMIAVRSRSGRPIAVLANFSMHYYSGQKPVGADYFGLFCEGFSERVKPAVREKSKNGSARPFLGLLSHGCSGDIWRRDYTQTPDKYDPYPKMEEYTQAMLDRAFSVYESIQYTSDADLQMAETRMELKYRVADAQRLQWAKTIVDAMGDRPPNNSTEVYAREQLILAERQSTEVVVQAIRIGEIGIVTTPNETYALTGLKFKLQSPLPKTMVIELANGGDGYIPPPEQHLLGGYNTWAARSAGLEVQAEPKIVEAGLQLLEHVADKPRRIFRQGRGPTSQRLAQLKPVAWWRLDEMAGVWAKDSSGHDKDAVFDPAVAFFLEGPASDKICTPGETNRCVHFAGGRLRARLPRLKQQYTVSMWFWNGLPADARATTGWLFSHDNDLDPGQHGIHLGLGGTATSPGRVILQQGDGTGKSKPVVGSTQITRWTWYHIALVRDGSRMQVFLNGNPKPEIETQLDNQQLQLPPEYFFGGRSDNQSNWEGRLDEITVFDRSLTTADLKPLTP